MLLQIWSFTGCGVGPALVSLSGLSQAKMFLQGLSFCSVVNANRATVFIVNAAVSVSRAGRRGLEFGSAVRLGLVAILRLDSR